MEAIQRTSKALERLMNGKTVRGKSPMDFAMEAWVYNKERGLPLEYLKARARFLLLDELRLHLGRQDRKPKKKTFNASSALEFLEAPSSCSSMELPDHPLFREICLGLLEGWNQKEIAGRLGLHKETVYRVIKRNKHLLLTGTSNAV